MVNGGERFLGSDLKEAFVFFQVFFFFIVVLLVFSSFSSVVAVPVGPALVNITGNETRTASTAAMVNISGGYIATLNITARVQNPRWKAFVGWINGKFALDDANGSTIYDWTFTTTSGEVYATRNSSTITWTNLSCATLAQLESENIRMSHTSSTDNISKTFSDTTHAQFFIGALNISVDSCRTLNTYKNNATQDVDFEEVALYEGLGANIIYATLLESSVTGFDAVPYDFQMIVPENGALAFSGATAYYLYVELT